MNGNGTATSPETPPGTAPGTAPGAGASGTRALLRAARLERGWSQSEAARRLAELASRHDGTPARPGSLKTQLSRWENGHATPAPEHRDLLVELYGESAAELGLEPSGPAAGDGGDRLRAALGRAAALDGIGLALLRDQLRATVALDHRLGTAAAHAALSAQVEHLRELLTHCVDPGTGERLAGFLAGAALLAGDQERDRDAPDLAWRAYALAGDAARRADRSDLAALALERRERLRHELGAAGTATASDTVSDTAPDTAGPRPGGTAPPLVRIDRQEPPVPVWADLEHDGGDEPSARDRTEAALHEAVAAHGAGRTEDAAAATARARRLALRTGSARTLARLDGLIR